MQILLDVYAWFMIYLAREKNQYTIFELRECVTPEGSDGKVHQHDRKNQ